MDAITSFFGIGKSTNAPNTAHPSHHSFPSGGSPQFKELQKIGYHRDRTELFKKYRHSKKLLAEYRTRETLDLLGRTIKKDPSSHSLLERALSFTSSPSGSPHCIFCGKLFSFLEKKITCKLFITGYRNQLKWEVLKCEFACLYKGDWFLLKKILAIISHM